LKIAILNDTHCGTRNSSEIFMQYQEDFYKKVFFPYLKENGIKNILHLGDYYEHRKYVNFKALNHNRKVFLDELKKDGIVMDIIPGNHDVFYKNTNELCSLKELLGYYTANVNIIMEPRVMDYDGTKIAVVPWINNQNYADTMKFLKKCKASIVGAHLELNGFDMMKGVKNTHGMEADVFHRFEQVWSGHFHTKSAQGNVHYLGSQMEFTWADADDPKYFHVFDTETHELTPVRNPLTIFQKVVYNDEKMDYNSIDVEQFKNKFVKVVVVKKTDPYAFDKFIDRLQDVDTHELKIAETFTEFLGENVEDDGITVEDTPSLLDSYVDAVETDLDKDKMKVLMRTLYTEAANMEIA
jgi:DNA repair exonuclease SbcCD nuclease subunit